MTAADLRDDLLVYLGVEDYTYAPPFYLKRIVNDLQSVLTKIYIAQPSWVSDTPGGILLSPPTEVSGLTLTNGATTFTGTFPEWAGGCCCLLGNDPKQNYLNDALNGLVMPYAGSTGSSLQGTVYQDAINPGPCFKILPPVKLIDPTGVRPHFDLSPMMSQATLGAHDHWGHGGWYSSYWGTARGYGYGGGWRPGRVTQSGYGTSGLRHIQTPQRYLVEALNTAATGMITPKLRIDPLPDQAYTLEWRVKAGLIVTDINDDSTQLMLPMGAAEAVLLPLCRAELATFPHFSGDPKAVAAAATDAWKSLGSLTDPKGQVAQGLQVGEFW